MKYSILIMMTIMFLSACKDDEDTIPNKLFQEKCIERGGEVVPTRWGVGGCLLDGYSYSRLDGIRI